MAAWTLVLVVIVAWLFLNAVLTDIRNILAATLRMNEQMMSKLETIAKHSIEISNIKMHLEHGEITTVAYDPDTDPAKEFE